MHNHARGACDLPALAQTARFGWRATSCYWGFFYTGVNECSCTSCHRGPQGRARNRAERHRDRAALGVALNAWRGGDRTAFDALIPQSRRPRA
jgi:hypothetical protein